MLGSLSRFGIYLLNPNSWVEYIWKLLVLCSLATLGAIMSEYVRGSLDSSLAGYFMIVSGIAAPLFSLVMYQTRSLVSVQGKLEALAATDILTGLNNRRAFLNSLEQRDGGFLILLDVDHFKRINDTYGHAVGDRVLVAVADALRSHIRQSDMIARVGGEEFAVHLDEDEEKLAVGIVERLVEGISVKEHDDEFRVTLSAGMVPIAEDGRINDIFHMADVALYQAKAAGRATFRLGTPGLAPPVAKSQVV